MKNASYLVAVAATLLLLLSTITIQAQQNPIKDSVPSVDGQLGPCSQWAGSCTISDGIYRMGNVSIGSSPLPTVGLTVGSMFGEIGGVNFEYGVYAKANKTAMTAISTGSDPTFASSNSGGGDAALFNGNARIIGNLFFNNSSSQINYQNGLQINPGNFKFNPSGLMEVSSMNVAGHTQSNSLQTGTLNITGLTTASTVHVNTILYSKDIIVKLPPFPDYVFEKDYPLMPLGNLEAYINANKRLPNMPSAKDIAENGGNMGELHVKQMEKIEELTLYVLELNKRLEKLEAENKRLIEQLKD